MDYLTFVRLRDLIAPQADVERGEVQEDMVKNAIDEPASCR